MEYVEGVDLGRLLVQAGPLPVVLACEAIRQTAEALHYAHQRDLLHCDVKPSNLLLVHPPRPCWDSTAWSALTDGRQPVRVKLLDMGLARRIDGADAAPEENQGGTPDYMAPERGSDEPIDGRSDLYSLGCTFYHLLTGQLPFPGGDLAGKLLRHRLDSPAPILGLRPDLPDDVAAVVERLMARDAADRYATAADAASALEACMVGRSLRDRRKGETAVGATEAEEADASRLAPLLTKPPAKRAAYHRLARPALALAVVLSAVCLGGAAWWSLPPHAEAPSSYAPLALPFVIEGRPGGFSSLAEAIAAADDGAVVTIHGPGPYPTPPLTWRGRSLTLRAAAGSRPCLERTGPAADPWQALFTTDGDLTLTGLDLRSPANATESAAGRLICCERAALHLTDCRLWAPNGAGIVYRNGGELSLQGCRVETRGTAVSVEIGGQKTCVVRIVNTVLEVRDPSGAALALWAPEVRQPTAVEVELTGDTFTAARTAALTALPARLHLTARGDDFFFRDALLSCAGYADHEGWKRTTTWQGSDNRYHGSGTWLTLDGAAADVNNLAAWRGLWGDDEARSREETDEVGRLLGIMRR